MRYLLRSEVVNAIAQLNGPAWLCAQLQWRAGLRISEALAIKPSDIDFAAATLTVQSGKGGKRRTVPLHNDLANILKAQPASDQRFIRKHRSTIFRAYRAAGIEGTHTLRHSAARHWLNEGVPINQVQLLLGHARLTTTTVYLGLVAPSPEILENVS